MDVTKLDSEIKVAARNQEFDATALVKAQQIACKFVADRIVSWSLKDVGIHDVPVTADAVGRLQVYLFERLYKIIRGMSPNDLDPEWDKKQLTDAEQLKN
jgi:hypothetical protein